MKPILAYGLGGKIAVTKTDNGFVYDRQTEKEKIRQIANAGAEQWRAFLFSVWAYKTKTEVFCPWILNDDNLFDLGKFNQQYFEIMKQNIADKNAFDIKPILDIVYGNETNGDESFFSPWMHNHEGVKGWFDPAADQFLVALIEKILQEFKGLDYELNLGNECNQIPMVRAFEKVIIPTLKKHGVLPGTYGASFKPYFRFELDAPGREIVKRFGLEGRDLMKDAEVVFKNAEWMATLSTQERAIITEIAKANTDTALHKQKKLIGLIWGDDKFERMVGIPVHHCTNKDDEQIILTTRYYGGDRPNKLVYSDDGAFDGEGPDCRLDMPKKCRPSTIEWAGMIEFVLKEKHEGVVVFEHTPEQHLNLPLQVSILESMAGTIKKITGHYPKNYHRYPEPVDPIDPVDPVDPDDPVIPDVEPPKPTTTCGKTRWYQHLKPWGNPTWNFKAAFAHLAGKHNVKEK